MKRVISCITAILILITATMGTWLQPFAESGAKEPDNFTADFTSADRWQGLTEYLAYKGDKFGNEDGWNNRKGSITTKDTYSFGSVFDLHFSLYTEFRNGNKNGENEDFYVTVGKFKIAVCDFQTRIVLYYDGKEVPGTTKPADLTYTPIRNYNYDVHFEAGAITIKSDLLDYSSNFSNFGEQTDAAVSITINETYQIYIAYFGNFSIDHASTEVRNKSFTADFSNVDQWTGLTEYLGYQSSKFGVDATWSNKKGALITRKAFDFGETFDIRFSLYTDYRNGNKNGANEDFYITVGDFKLAICDFQTRLVLSYKGNIIPLEGDNDNDYVTPRDYHYEVHIEKGNITVISDLLSYTSSFSDFEAVNNAKVSIEINEDWQIWTEYFSDLFVGKIIETPRDSAFRADFSNDTQWTGLTEYLGYLDTSFGNNLGWGNKAGTITTKDKYDFGTQVDASFKLKTNYANGNKNTKNEDFYVVIGDFKIAVCDFQTRIAVYYKNKLIEGTTADADLTYIAVRDYAYSVHIEKGNITVDSDLLHYKSTFDGFESVDKANVAVTINETYHIWDYAFSELLVNIKPPVIEYPNCGKKLVSLFDSDDIWDGEMVGLIDKGNKIFPSDTGWKNKTGALKSKGVYDFSDTFYIFTSLKTSGPNAGYRVDKPSNRNSVDYRINAGKFAFEIRGFQNQIAVLYDGKEIAAAKNEVYDYADKEYTYAIYVSPGKLTVEQRDGDKTLLTIKSDFSGYEAVNGALASIEVCESWQITAGRFSYLIIAAASENITSAEAYFKQLEHDRYDWSKNAYGGSEFSTDFRDRNLWTGDMVDFVDTQNRRFAVESGWKNTTGKLVSAKWYDLGDAFISRFTLYTTYPNNAYKSKPTEKNLNCTEFKVDIGDFSVELRYFQNVVALYYKEQLIALKKADDLTYNTKNYAYVLRVKKGEIVLQQMDGTKTLMEIKSDFSDFEPLKQARIGLEVLETWQVYTSYFSNISVSKLADYPSKYSFNAKEDIKTVLAQKDTETAWIKSQWSVKQKNAAATGPDAWISGEISKKLHISGFHKEMPIEPSPVPVVNIACGSYSSQVGIYNDSLVLRTNFTDNNGRATALSFEAPADGKVWLHDPEYGMVAVVNEINGQNTWCMNSSKNEVKSAKVAIYKNDQKIWPADSDGYQLGNSNTPGLSAPVLNFAFPEIVLDVKTGDMLYIVVTPKHHLLSGAILSSNPTLISFNPQIDYISLDSELKLNTSREKTVEEVDVNIASRISAKSAAIAGREGKPLVMPIIIVASAILLVALIIGAILFIRIRIKKAKVKL